MGTLFFSWVPFGANRLTETFPAKLTVISVTIFSNKPRNTLVSSCFLFMVIIACTTLVSFCFKGYKSSFTGSYSEASDTGSREKARYTDYRKHYTEPS